jgi:hypothetical protein
LIISKKMLSISLHRKQAVISGPSSILTLTEKVATAESHRRDEGKGFENFDGTYTYTYGADGRKSFHSEEWWPNKGAANPDCIFDAEFFKNGLVDWRSVKQKSDVSGSSQNLFQILR